MSDNRARMNRGRWRSFAAAPLAALTLAAAGPSGARTAAAAETFSSPDKAADALAAAWHGGQAADLRRIFGPAGDRLVRSGDPVAEGRAWARLAAAYDKGHHVEGVGGGRVVLVIGEEAWPYPIPLVKTGARWRFDVKAGAEQILDRRIGRDEAHAIEICLAYVQAQRDFAALGHAGGGPTEYARKVASTPGRHDGLYWPAADGAAESPLGPLVAAAEAHGYGEASAEGTVPYQGYYYRILDGQGASAPGGARTYMAGGHMTRGFALVAYPAKYGASGVMTFIVNQHGVVFEKNLGPRTASLARRMAVFDPDRSWKIAEPPRAAPKTGA